jgi:hypothetical protein
MALTQIPCRAPSVARFRVNPNTAPLAARVGDARVVDHSVQSAEGVHGRVYDLTCSTLIGDRGVACDGTPSGVGDLADHIICRTLRCTRTGDVRAVVGDDDTCALRRKQQGMATTDAAPGSGDNHRALIET